jgi:glutathione peroxidase
MADGAHAFSFAGLTGGTIDLKAFAGKPVLVVNTASACGYTPQYADLEALHEQFGARGLVVLAVPSNDFGAQEPGDATQIAEFCATRYRVGFPIAAKQQVLGPQAHPFYRWIAATLGEGAVPRWNFHKFLVGPDGALVDGWPSQVNPRDPRIVSAIEPHLE